MIEENAVAHGRVSDDLRAANLVSVCALGLVTFARMDAFLRLAKGLSPANANRDAEKVFQTLNNICNSDMQSCLTPFCCDDPDQYAWLVVFQCTGASRW